MVFYSHEAASADMKSEFIDLSALLDVDMYTLDCFLAPANLDFFSNFVWNAKIHNINLLVGCGNRARTDECGSQSPVPFLLAMPQKVLTNAGKCSIMNATSENYHPRPYYS